MIGYDGLCQSDTQGIISFLQWEAKHIVNLKPIPGPGLDSRLTDSFHISVRNRIFPVIHDDEVNGQCFLFICLEVMFIASAFAFASVSALSGNPDGQIMFLFILTVAAAEVAIGLALVLRFEERFKSLNIDVADKLRG